MEKRSWLRPSEQQSDPAAFCGHTPEEMTALYHRHIETVYRVCLSMMGNRADAEDAAQAVFLKLLRDPTPFADVEHEKAWLITAARNQCRDIYRGWWRRKVALDDTILPKGAEPDHAGLLPELLLRLPPKERLLLYLHYYEGYKLSEIAVLLGLNLNTVKTRMRAAKRKLQMEWEDDER